MKTATLTIGVLLILALVFPAQAVQKTPVSTTIPAIAGNPAGVIFECAPFQAFPGSVTIGSSGFVRIECPTTAALTLDGTLTASFTLPMPYTNAGIVSHTSDGNPCNYVFHNMIVGNVTLPTGSLLNRTLTFSSAPVQGNLLTTGYDYCFQYSNATASGLPGFTVTWG